ncbi:DUF805 domain-containing protein [Pseudoruegeria sp. HB172150]|uniref:DUF805 domain-containing protein n=1 Tax=Pseudoruegeria sp. HB172150 TaxID=2721164 RepID=UPI00155711B1|nr:DUF805 domain-containing protein [Pseudoruegeria sp. HB172150]
MRMPAAILRCLGHSFTFSGRASRTEYWGFLPFGLLLPVSGWLALRHLEWPALGTERLALSALLLVPLAAVTARRMNDAGFDARDVGPPATALMLFLLELVVYARFLKWATTGAGFELFLVSMPLLLVTPLFIVTTFYFGLLSGASLFGHMAIPSEPGPNRHGPNPTQDAVA